MNLKDQIAKDNNNVFLNNNDFADTYNIKYDNKSQDIVAVIDNDVLRQGGNAQGVYLGMKRVFVNANDFPHRFAIGARITIDGKTYYVRDNGEEMGMYVITIEANKN
jgi:hypothetical protein